MTEVAQESTAKTKSIVADVQARMAAVAALAKQAGVDGSVAKAAFAIDKNPANDLVQAKAIGAALNAYTETKDSWGVYFKSLFSGPKVEVIAHNAAVDAAKSAGAGPNDVPNLVAAAEKLAR